MNESNESKIPSPEEFIQQFSGFAIPQDLGFLIPANTPVEFGEMNGQIAEMMKQNVIHTRGAILGESLNLEKRLCFLCGITKKDDKFDFSYEKTLSFLSKTMGTVINNFMDSFPWELVSEESGINKENISKSLKEVVDIRNRFAHDIAGFVVYRHSFSTPYLPVLLGKEGIFLIDELLLNRFNENLRISLAYCNQLDRITGRMTSA